MMTVEEIIKRVAAYSPHADVEVIRAAAGVAAKAHSGQKRQSGKPYLEHPLEVSGILTQLKLDVPSISSGLLHDVVEDTSITLQDVEKQFGKEIASIVDGVTKIGKIQVKSDVEQQAENFRKMLLSMARDIRVILIKLADRLHNMRTLQALPEEKQKWIAQETLDIYVPLANRLGIGWIKVELEDWCFRFLKPEMYFSLVKKIAQKKEEREKCLQDVIALVEKNLKEYGFRARVMGRPKHLHGIYRKMEQQGIPFEEVYDLTGLRIITTDKMSCYAILGMIHSVYRPVPGRFKDYIGVPKSNMYQSLHTTVVGPRGEHVEFQIRTEEMHQVAEEGIAAHWKYKEKGHIDEKDNRVFTWLRQLVEWHQDVSDNRQFMDSIKMDLLPDVVYVFTPKGDVKELVKGSTPIDLAYGIHTEVGNRCAGAKVNGKLVPLRHELKSGDTVEVLTSPQQVPSKDWLKVVRTARAKTKIKHWIRIEERRRGLEIGKKLFEREMRKQALSPGDTMKALPGILKEFGLGEVDDLFVAIGYGKISSQHIIHRLCPAENLKEGLKDKIVRKIGIGQQGVEIKGLDDLLIHLSKCCSPLPGDRIIGYITRGRGLSIHTLDCPNIDELDADPDRLVEVTWDSKSTMTHSVELSVVTMDRPGLLASVSASIAAASANISQAEITTSEDKKAILNFVVDVMNIKHLERILRNIERVDGVLSARRVRRR